MSDSLECNGAGRDTWSDHSLCFYFNRRPTDEEMRFLHDAMKYAASCVESDRLDMLPDWPPRVSAIGLPDGHRRFGSTGQLFEVRNGQWMRIKRAIET